MSFAMLVRSLVVMVLGTVIWAQTPATVERDLRVDREPRRYALVIGNNAYPKWPLMAAVNDARTLADALRDVRFQVEVVTDASRKQMERAISGFVSRIAPGDIALLYYAGHGIQIDTENYLIPVDFEAQDEIDARYEAYSASRLVEKLESTGARLKIVVLDACRNNPFKITRSSSAGLAQMNVSGGRGVFIALATAPGKVAVEDTKAANGVFTQQLVKVLKAPGLTLNEVFDRVRIAVDQETQGQQTPWATSSVIGNFRFREAVVEPPAPIPAPQPVRVAPDTSAEVAYWTSVKDANDAELFADYLRRFPNGLYVEIARKRIGALIPDGSLIGIASTTEDMAAAALDAANKLLETQKFAQGMVALNVAVILNPKLAAAFERRSWAENEMGRFDHAILDANSALKLNAGNPIAIRQRGFAYAGLKQYQRAVDDYSEAVRLKADYGQAYYDRARAYWDLKQTEKAIADFNQAIRFNPTSSWYVDRGVAVATLKKFDSAVQDFSEAIRLQPDNYAAYLNRCRAHNELEEFDHAVEDCTTALGMNAKDPMLHNALGQALASSGKPEKALESFTAAIKLKPGYEPVIANRGFVYLRLKRYDRALEDFAEALRLQPGSTYAMFGRSLARRSAGNKAEADKDLARAKEMGFVESELPVFAKAAIPPPPAPPPPVVVAASPPPAPKQETRAPVASTLLSAGGSPKSLATPPPVLKETQPIAQPPDSFTHATAVAKPEPEYTEQARRARFEGSALLRVSVDEHGIPQDVQVISPAGLGLDDKAVDAVRHWKFDPARKNGVAVPSVEEVEVNFRLPGTTATEGLDRSERVRELHNAAVHLFTGDTGKKDVPKAIENFTTAANRGFVHSQGMLCNIYLNGATGIAPDPRAALQWCKKAAEQKLSGAQYAYGTMLAKGIGVEPDPSEAVKWLRKAADQNWPPAQASLGLAYLNGAGVTQSVQDAAKWLKRAAEYGDGTAQLEYGKLFEAGTGVQQDIDTAFFWYLLSARRGNAGGREALTRLAPKFTPEKLQQFDERADRWKPKPLPQQ